MEKQFSLENRADKPVDYKNKILKIINDIELRAKVVEPDELLHHETHRKSIVDTKHEVVEFEEVRKDVCESFDVKYDDEHVYIYSNPTNQGSISQRSLRAFFILIDVRNKEGFYGEGRIDHNTLFRNLAILAGKIIPGTTFESVLEKMDLENKDYLVFKGFLSVKEFKELSERSRKVLESPILDENGEPIKTADEWFLTGHNLD